ncbi:trypsin-like peptidase domain-containing protein [Sinorhizobium sp. 7-81]|uniref:trypsin-like peptidase domain-containing protein n=1 Tax=Sinorhizobium sp. 8-89 TaxID=3049089 RepID=UPI0024C21DA8|nr:trypsin-like peptidase domain-containing protein [Sinorhizobium sp. 8-89]MDK1491238.1 trypsin-like peptidase domain-containing protein [Sinorhizobium sp. 8-89]
MLKISTVLALAALLNSLGGAAGATEIEAGVSAVLRRVQPAVVSIRTASSGIFRADMLDDPNVRRILGLPDDVVVVQTGVTTTGSGVIIDHENGYIITSRHLVADADDVSVKLADGRVFQADRIGEDAPTDLAVVKVEAPSLSSVKWGRSSELKVGDFVIAVGSPLGLTQTATFGIISGLGRSGLGADEYQDYIQTDAAINPGNSGGALVNASGELIGIARGIPAPDEASTGIGFAIPSDIAMQIARELIAHGEYRRGWLGLSVTGAADIRPGSAAETQKFVVNELVCNSPAERQGVRLGDIIVALDGRTFPTDAAFRNAISLLSPNTRITLDVRRGEKLQQVNVMLSDAAARRDLDSGQESVVVEFPSANGSPACAPAGAVVVDVASGSDAYSMGLRTGDYLTAINGQPPTSVEQIRSVLESTQESASVDILRAGTAYRLELE